MNKKTIVFGIVAVVLVSVGIWVSANNAPAAQSAGTLQAAQETYDFGTIPMAGGMVEYTYALTNNSEEAVTIREISTSCMCTTAYLSHQNHQVGPFGMSGHGIQKKADITVQPGEQAGVRVVFDPAAHGPAGAGAISRGIYLQTNSQVQPIVNLSFTAQVTL